MTVYNNFAYFIILSFATLCVSFSCLRGPGTRKMVRKEKPEKLQARTLHDKLQLRIQTLSEDEHQRSAMRCVAAYFENECNINVNHIDSRLTYLEVHGVHGLAFNDLFSFLHEVLLQRECKVEANYLHQKVGL